MMRAGWIVVLAALAAVLSAGNASGQQALFRDPQVQDVPAGAENLILLPLETPVVSSPSLFLRDAAAPLAVEHPDLPPSFPNLLSIDVGFQYLQPHFNSRAVALAIPSSAAGGFPVLANARNLSNDFGFVPHFAAAYDFADLGFGLSASGKLLNLSGSLSRTTDSAAGSGNVTGQASVNIAVVNVLEGTKVFGLGDGKLAKGKCWEDCRFTVTVGGRYAHVDQSFTASLASGANLASAAATQNYDGFGPTVSLGGLCPLCDNWHFYWFTRGSFLVGNNVRETHTSVAVSGSTASGGAKLAESETTIAPVGELELGFAYNILMGGATRAAPERRILAWLKVGAVANVWGSLGLLSITDGPQHFSDGSLSLYGFSIMLGFQR